MFERNNEKETKLNPIIKIGTVFALSAAALTGCATANAEGPVTGPGNTNTSSETSSPTSVETTPSAPAAPEFNNPESFVLPSSATNDEIASWWIKVGVEQQTAYLSPSMRSFFKYYQSVDTKGADPVGDAIKSHETNLFNTISIPNWQDTGISKAYDIALQQDVANVLNYDINTNNTLEISFALADLQIVNKSENSITVKINLVESYKTTNKNDENTAKLDGYQSSEIITLQKSGDKFLLADWQAGK